MTKTLSPIVLEIINDLPSRPVDALAVVADRARTRIINPSATPGHSDDYMAIVTFIDRFSKRFNLGIEFPQLDASAGNYQRLVAYVNEIRSLGVNAVEKNASKEIDELIYSHEGLSDNSFGLAHLNEDEKRKILQHLEQARLIIQSSEISDRKKNALLERLSDLIKEVYLYGTSADRFFAFAGDLGFVLGDMAEKAKPLIDEIKEVLKLVTRARARQEGISLPSGDQVLQLTPPDESE